MRTLLAMRRPVSPVSSIARWGYVAASAFVWFGISAVHGEAQEPWSRPSSVQAPPLISSEDFARSCRAAEPTYSSGLSRFALFRMPTGFLADPVGLNSDDDPDSTDAAASEATMEESGGRLGLAIGSDNPYFDLHDSGAPGGVGYYKMHGQYQVIDSPSTNLCVAVQAAAPAGGECDGATHGPTIMRPSVAYFQEISNNLAVHGFFGKSMVARPGWDDDLQRGLRYGIALASPVPGITDSQESVHMFIEALGRSRDGDSLNPHTSPGYQLLPGVHWRVGENWWMSGGMIVPIGAQRFEAGLWQFTCSWRF